VKKDSKALASEVEALRAEIVELDAVEAPTEEQTARFAAAIEEFDARKAELDEAVAREEKIEAIRSAMVNPANVERGFHAPNVVVKRDAFENLDRLAYTPESEKYDRAMQVVEDATKSRTFSSEAAEEVARKVETIRGVSDMVLLTGSDAYRSAFEEYMRTQGRPNYTSEEAAAVRASASLTSANGGYALPWLLDASLIHTGTATKNPLRRIARVEQGTQNVWHGVTAGAVTTYWVAENTALTDGTGTMGGPSVTAAKLTGYVTGSYEIFEDSALLQQLPGLIGEAFDYAEQTAFISGSGSGAPKGIVTAISATSASTVTATTRGAFTTASAVDVFALLNSVAPRFEDSSHWIANKATFNTIKQMSTGSQGSYFWSDFNVAGGGGRDLLGSPTVACSDMSSATTSGTVLIVLGDFSRFLIYDRLGTTVEFIQNVVDGSGLPTGTRGLVAHKRVGSDVLDLNAFRFLKT
jgi:HK97 family phage major capsid protein